MLSRLKRIHEAHSVRRRFRLSIFRHLPGGGLHVPCPPRSARAATMGYLTVVLASTGNSTSDHGSRLLEGNVPDVSRRSARSTRDSLDVAKEPPSFSRTTWRLRQPHPKFPSSQQKPERFSLLPRRPPGRERGQTTASLAAAQLKNPQSPGRYSLPMKLSVVTPARRPDLIPLISRSPTARMAFVPGFFAKPRISSPDRRRPRVGSSRPGWLGHRYSPLYYERARGQH